MPDEQRERAETQIVEGFGARREDATPTSVASPAGVSGVYSAIHAVTGDGVTIGRAADNDLIVDDLLVSRYHAILQGLPDGGWELLDSGSANGTFVNGRRITRAKLEELDVVTVGHHVFRLVGSRLEEYVDDGLVSFQASALSVRTSSGAVLLDGVSFALDQRAFLAVVGPSGAGKSTLLNALTGFRPATTGVVLYDGRDLYADYEELRLRIGFVPQEDILHRELSVRQALGYAAELRFPEDVEEEARIARVEEVIGELGLDPAGDLPIHRLSGGQRRRVAVAVELMTKPSLLFLDEPTSGLDPGYERSLMELLRGLADDGRTVVVVTHSVQSIRLCDRVLFLAPGGRPAYYGPAQLAPAYFGREDFQEIFQELSGDDERDWGAEFREHPDHERFIGDAPAEPERPAAERPTAAPPRPRGRLAQTALLSRRYARVTFADRRNLAFLVAQPLILGLLMLAALPAGELAPPEAGELRAVSRAGLVLLVLVLGTTWLGASNAIREIVKELPIVRRERSAGLSVFAYLASKCLVLGSLTAVQCAALAAIALARQGSHGQGALLASPPLELIVVAVLAGLAGMTLALLVSALAATTEQAMTMLPVVIVFEMLLAMGGVFPDVVEKPVLKQASYLASTQWALSASASTVDLDRLQSIDKVAREAPTVRLDQPLEAFEDLAGKLEPEPRWQHDPGTWLANAGALVGLFLAGAAGAGVAVNRRGHD